MRTLRRKVLISFGTAYTIVVMVLGLIAYGLVRQVSGDLISFFQLLLTFVGAGYLFASILAWTGFANVYRYSPTLYFGSYTYRQIVSRGGIAQEGRDRKSLWIGSLFGLSLLGTAYALTGWVSAALVIAVAVAVVSMSARWRHKRSGPSGHP